MSPKGDDRRSLLSGTGGKSVDPHTGGVVSTAHRSTSNSLDRPTDRYQPTSGGLGRWCERWANILWYHSPRQLLGRVSRIARDRFFPGRVRKRIDDAIWREEELPWSAPLDHPISDVDRDDLTQFSRGRLRLLNLSQMVNRPIDWRRLERRSLPPLWMFHLHYHDYLRRWIGIAGSEAIVAEVLTSWLDEFGEGGVKGWGAHPVAWHPYVISRRVFAWSALLVGGRWRRVFGGKWRNRWHRRLIGLIDTWNGISRGIISGRTGRASPWLVVSSRASQRIVGGRAAGDFSNSALILSFPPMESISNARRCTSASWPASWRSWLVGEIAETLIWRISGE